ARDLAPERASVQTEAGVAVVPPEIARLGAVHDAVAAVRAQLAVGGAAAVAAGAVHGATITLLVRAGHDAVAADRWPGWLEVTVRRAAVAACGVPVVAGLAPGDHGVAAQGVAR